MTIEWLHMPEGVPIENAIEVNYLMVKLQNDFKVVDPGQYSLFPKIKPRNYHSSRRMRVNSKGAVIGPNINEQALIHDVASHYGGEPGTNCDIFLLKPGDVYILTGPNRDRTGALVHDIVKYTNREA